MHTANPSIVNLSYAAALLDATGAIIIAHDKTSNTLRVRVDITDDDLAVLREIRSHFEGVGRIYPRKGTLEEQGYYILSFHNEAAVQFLAALLPFLKGQKRQAELGIKLNGRIKKKSRAAGGVVYA